MIGLLAVFKPRGFSSNDAVTKIKIALRKGYQQQAGVAKCNIKVGHGGTLDPLAEGVLVIGVGHGTKLLDSYLAGSKAYEAVAVLGTETDTYDSTGKVTETLDCSHVTIKMLEEALPVFRGDILQIPPMYSALKRDGKKLYELAREGIEVERAARPVSVYGLQLLQQYHGSTRTPVDMVMNLPTFGLHIECSGGFYVRSVIRDIARECKARAHMTDLLRTKQGIFTMSDCLYVQDWNYESICSHIVKSSKLVDIDCDNLPSAVSSSK
jgi:tRNA pseudouridine55 synthase